MKFLLPFLTAMLAVQSASAQSLWRNFFTTNRDPIVEVVAGSNATVQATTVGSNLRRFTVNSTATGSGTNSLVQTNISWTAVTNLQSSQVPYTVITNAPWQYGDADLTNWATLSTNVLSTLGQTNISYTAVTNAPWQYGSANLTNWGQLTTNVLSTLGQTNISYTAVTNAPWQYGGANLTNWGQLTTNVLGTLAQTNISLSAVTNANYLTNWATINTNTYVVKTGDTVSGPILTTSSTSNAPSATELVTANWVRNLFNSGADYYNTTNIDSGATNVGSSQPVYKFQSTIPISDARSYTTANFLTNGGYVGSVITTNTFSQISGAALVTAFLGFTGGVGGPTLTLHPEIYYSYDKTNWYGDWSGTDESIVNGTTNIYQWAISIPVTTSTNVNGFYVSRRFKVGTITGSGVRTLTVLIGTNAVSGTSTAGHVTMESPTATAGNAFLANNQTFTGSNHFTIPLVSSVASNTPSSGQVLTATSSSSAAWQTPASGGGLVDSEFRQINRMFDDFVESAPVHATIGDGIFNFCANSSGGSVGQIFSPTNSFGIWRLGSGNAGSYGLINSGPQSVGVFPYGVVTNEWRFKIGGTNQQTAANNYSFFVGFNNLINGTVGGNALGFKYDTNTLSFVCVSQNTGGTTNNITSSVAYVTDQWFVLRFVSTLNSTGTNVIFSINGTSIATNSTGSSVPIGSTGGMPLVAFVKKIDGAVEALLDLDYVYLGYRLEVTR